MIPVTSASAPTQRIVEALADAAGGAVLPTRRRKPPAPYGRKDPRAEAEALAHIVVPTVARGVRAAASAAKRSRRATPGYAKSGAAQASSSNAKGSLAFLRDPKLSIEEKLMRLLSYQNEKWEKEMQTKLDELAGGEGQSSSSSSSSSSSALGGAAGAFAKAFGGGTLADAALGVLKMPVVRTALEKVGGPVLGAAASALGFPAAAPILVRYGGKILGAAAGAASKLAGSKGSKSSKSSGTKGATEGKAMSDAKRQQITLEIQRVYEKQKEMFSLVSSIMRVSHETRSAVIGNIR